MSQKRSVRRHHAERLRNKRKNYWSGCKKTDRILGMLISTPKICSCALCRNPRRNGEKTVQERRIDQDYR